MQEKCQCPCGATQFTLTRKPMMRVICHCQHCQAFNDAPYADIAVCLESDVELPTGMDVKFETFQKGLAVQRGRCPKCNAPAIEFFRNGKLPDIVVIPTQNVSHPEVLPAPKQHIFYHRRQKDIADNLPKYSGYWPSQLAFARSFLGGLVARRRSAG